MAPPSQAELELLTFLSDPNASARQAAVEIVAGFSAQGNPRRSLLTQTPKLLPPLQGQKGKQLLGRDGKECDPIEDLKKLCQDQPVAANDAFSALINLSDSSVVASRIADDAFLTFLVTYIADPVSLLADLACMLLSNVTKFEPIAASLLRLKVQRKAFYNFVNMQDMNALIAGMDADPTAPDYAEKQKAAQERAKRVAEEAQAQQRREQEEVPALVRLLDAFEEGATVASNESAVEHMRRKVEQAQRQAEADASSSGTSEGARPKIKRKSNCNFLASVFANITVLPIGREWFVQPLQSSSASGEAAQEYPVSRIMIYTEHPDLIRRGGVISALKNILFVKAAHELLVAPPPGLPISPERAQSLPKDADDDARARFALCDKLLQEVQARRAQRRCSIDVLPYLLLPLCAGSELSELDLEDQELLPEQCQFMDEGKKREADPALRLMLVECLLLLCTGLYGRVCLRERGVYIVVREAHSREADEKITEAVVRLVNILKRDESDSSLRDIEEEEGDGGAGSTDASANHAEGKSKLLGEIDVGTEDPAATADDSDDEDLVIEEL